MVRQRFGLAFCALVISVILAGGANAYPTTSTTTMTKTYRPLDLELSTLVAGYDAYTSGVTFDGSKSLSVTLVFTGTYTGYPFDADSKHTDYPDDAVGNAGYWVYQLDAIDGVADLEVDGTVSSTITVSAKPGTAFGTFTYVGGFEQPTSDKLPSNDTPLKGDVFKLFTLTEGLQLTATIVGTDFTLTVDDLVHVGPFVQKECKSDDGDDGDEDEGCSNNFSRTFEALLLDSDPDDEFCLVLDDKKKSGRNYPGCTEDSLSNCGTVTNFFATSIPEPSTVTLFGLGLTGLSMRLRSRRKASLQ
jgi:hypothetical protein